MPIIVPAGFAQVTLQFTQQSSVGSVPVTTFGIDRPPSDDSLEWIAGWALDSYVPLLTSGMRIRKISLKSDVGYVEAPVDYGGGGSGSYAAPQVCPVIQKLTGLTGRANRGRMFWPGVVSEADVDAGGLLTGGAVVSLQSAVADLRAVLADNEASVVLFHSGSSDPTTVTSMPVQGQVATMRRRNRK